MLKFRRTCGILPWRIVHSRLERINTIHRTKRDVRELIRHSGSAIMAFIIAQHIVDVKTVLSPLLFDVIQAVFIVGGQSEAATHSVPESHITVAT